MIKVLHICFSICFARSNKFSFRRMRKRMRLLLMQPQTRRLTQILKRKSRIPNRKRKVSQIRRKRYDFQYPVYYVAVSIFMYNLSQAKIVAPCLFQLQRRMKIAELKQISTRPDVVEVRMIGQCLIFHSHCSPFLRFGTFMSLVMSRYICNGCYKPTIRGTYTVSHPVSLLYRIPQFSDVSYNTYTYPDSVLIL